MYHFYNGDLSTNHLNTTTEISYCCLIALASSLTMVCECCVAGLQAAAPSARQVTVSDDAAPAK